MKICFPGAAFADADKSGFELSGQGREAGPEPRAALFECEHGEDPPLFGELENRSGIDQRWRIREEQMGVCFSGEPRSDNPECGWRSFRVALAIFPAGFMSTRFIIGEGCRGAASIKTDAKALRL